jgi:hypothetical protein
VLRLSPRVSAARRGLDIVVRVRVKAGPQIHEACEMLKQRVREILTNGLGISAIRSVTVTVEKIVAEHRLQCGSAEAA